MIGERSQGSTLTSKAYTVTQNWSTTSQISTSGQWSIVDNYTIYRRVNMGYTGSSVKGEVWYNSFIFSGCTNNDYSLEYYVRVYTYGTTTLKYESTWIDNNEECAIWMGARSSSTSNSYEIYVRRKADENGNRGFLVPSDMRPSVAVFKGVNEYDYEEQTLPADWFATTTQTNLFIPLVTVTTPIDTYQGSHGGGGGERGVVYDLNYYLEIPQEVAGVVSYIFYLFGQIASLKYVTTLICLAMVLGTLRFIMR